MSYDSQMQNTHFSVYTQCSLADKVFTAGFPQLVYESVHTGVSRVHVVLVCGGEFTMAACFDFTIRTYISSLSIYTVLHTVSLPPAKD